MTIKPDIPPEKAKPIIALQELIQLHNQDAPKL
jgi:hypothetical protein